jgi:hypothetical protein
MSNVPSPIPSEDSGTAAERFFVVQELLGRPELARFYTDLLLHSPTTIVAARDRQGLSKSTAYKYANTLAELGVAEELDEYKNGSALWRVEPVSGVWTGDTTVEFGPVLIAVFGATSVNEDLELFVQRHGKATLAPAVMGTIEYLEGERTRRGVAERLNVSAVEGIAVTQAIEGIVALVSPHDPTLDSSSFEMSVHDRVIERTPYQRSDE